ncbi:hypothetical protein CEUSTIGMA_g5150.t1 [Chlamydomonas eustigma]|uniref:Uncharacterized protein n=1 Tax=Chlamydomonas eustigma TaxID=1157962 RepID=A0A250X3Q9_9CHLO|nr:hypothetical protein CEUSTIGMA_g5150.t1 [Chlamydomonas eustigma]|eukprot:GAX77707.1 hypothetical protein CEUSTIGMA_g5150.t1 [Chlamydomonas eustigma]
MVAPVKVVVCFLAFQLCGLLCLTTSGQSPPPSPPPPFPLPPTPTGSFVLNPTFLDNGLFWTVSGTYATIIPDKTNPAGGYICYMDASLSNGVDACSQSVTGLSAGQRYLLWSGWGDIDSGTITSTTTFTCSSSSTFTFSTFPSSTITSSTITSTSRSTSTSSTQS